MDSSFLCIFRKIVKNHSTKFGEMYNKCIKNIAQIFKRYILKFKSILKYIYIFFMFLKYKCGGI